MLVNYRVIDVMHPSATRWSIVGEKWHEFVNVNLFVKKGSMCAIEKTKIKNGNEAEAPRKRCHTILRQFFMSSH